VLLVALAGCGPYSGGGGGLMGHLQFSYSDASGDTGAAKVTLAGGGAEEIEDTPSAFQGAAPCTGSALSWGQWSSPAQNFVLKFENCNGGFTCGGVAHDCHESVLARDLTCDDHGVNDMGGRDVFCH
jgi:hypothetical protein